MDLRIRVDELFAARKSILGPPKWVIGQRPDTREMRRPLLEDGESRGAILVLQAYPRTSNHEFRHMIVLRPEGGMRADARCVARLDYAPTIDGPHINDFNGGAGYPACQVDDLHYHDWPGNKHLCKPKELPQRLLYAREIHCRINDIDDGFWWFCQQNQIDATSADVPGWPTLGTLL